MNEKYLKVIEVGPTVSGEERILQNRIRNIFLMTKDMSAAYKAKFNLDIRNLVSNDCETTYCSFNFRGVEVVLEYTFGAKYKNKICRFLDLFPKIYSTYDCNFWFKGDKLLLSVDEATKTMNNIIELFSNDKSKIDDEIQAKIKELTSR